MITGAGLIPLIVVVVLTLWIAAKSTGRVRKMAWAFLAFRVWLFIFFLPLILYLPSLFLAYFIIPVASTIAFYIYYKKSGNEVFKYLAILTALVIFSLIPRALGILLNFSSLFLWAPFIYLLIIFFKDREKTQQKSTKG